MHSAEPNNVIFSKTSILYVNLVMPHLTLNDKDLKQGVIMTFFVSVIAVASISLRRLHARASFNEVFLNHNDRNCSVVVKESWSVP